MMDTPGLDVEWMTGMVAGGAQLVVFTTGLGTPTGNPIAPVVKITGNARTAESMADNIDLDVSGMSTGGELLDAAADRLLDEILAVATGRPTAAERLLRREFAFTPTLVPNSVTNPNSSCSASLTFSATSGTGSVNTVVTASPADCSGIFDNTRASSGSSTSTNATKIVVPPQIMIRTVVGEAGGQPGDIDQQALLVVGRNRFGDRDFKSVGGLTATWQAVLIPSQFYGANNTTPDGPDQELRNAALVFIGGVGDIVGGAPCYWSPTNNQWANIQAALNSQTRTEPANAGYPSCYSGVSRQIVYKSSIGLNVSGGTQYNAAPAFVFLRKRKNSDPAVVQIN